MKLILTFVIVFLISVGVSCYKPVVLLHGVLSDHENMEVLAGFITSAHPGTEIHNIALYENKSSVDTPLSIQLQGIVEKMKPVLTDPNGVHLVCHSQGVKLKYFDSYSNLTYYRYEIEIMLVFNCAGGLLCRAIIETLDGHNIQNFVSLSAPMMGQFGRKLANSLLFRFLYHYTLISQSQITYEPFFPPSLKTTCICKQQIKLSMVL